MLSFIGMSAMDANRHASESVLSQGNWVKVSVNTTGLQFLSVKDLSSMGFTNPGNVKVFGYGALRLPDILALETYIDDLPQIPVLQVEEGIYFFGVGPQTRGEDASGNLILETNPFANYGYYFLTDSEIYDRKEFLSTGYEEPNPENSTDSFIDVVQHELDLYSPGETGHILVGEDLKYSPNREFRFNIVDPVEGPVKVGANILTNLISGSSWTLGIEGSESKTIAAPSSSSKGNIHGTMTSSWLEIQDYLHPTMNVKLSLAGGSGNTRAANVDRVTVNYPRAIKIPADNSAIFFSSPAKSICLGNAFEETEIWDVTVTTEPMKVNHSAPINGKIFFSTNSSGNRDYVAFTPGRANIKDKPVFVEKVANQNLHALSDIDMVIFSPAQWMSAARKLANYRASEEGMRVEVVDPEKIYNEFSSGVADINAFRKFLKMLYDRGSAGNGSVPRYALLFGRSSFDNRRLTSATSTLTYPLLPQWQTYDGMDDDKSFPTDDILGFLDDYSGARMGADTLVLSIGRLPATSLTQANLFVDKIIEYEKSSPAGNWKSKAVFLADDDDNGIHMSQTEYMIKKITNSSETDPLLIEKIYIDAYEYTGGIATGAREEFYRQLDEGVLWLNYIGHASSMALSGEGILNYSDVGSLFLRKLPFIYAATCDFMRWDASTFSGAEHLALTKGGGVIGAISATRPVYISQNGRLSNAMGEHLLDMDSEGNRISIGEILKRTKNSLKNDENKLRYVLLGDPSMRLLIPDNNIVIETIDGKPFPDVEADAVLKARQDLKLTGTVRDGLSGEIIEDFNGNIVSTLYDADKSVTTLGHGVSGARFTFDKHGGRLFVGNDSVVNGRFTVKIAMPSEVDDNYRPATLSLYAYNEDNTSTASTVEKRLYVYGTDEEAVEDTIAPVIDAMYLNHPSFKQNGIVNSSPMLIAEISDNHAINMSLAGIGHWMSLSLDDGAITYNDVSGYYQPESIDKGVLYYPLENLENGYHTIALRVWDAAGNSASDTLGFFVDSGIAPQVFDIYTDRNPASETAHFYLIHDRPDGNLKVEFMIYDLLGRTVWTNTSTGRADKYKSYPISWNLTDISGRRVPRGIYIYRAVVSDLDMKDGLGQTALTPAKKIAVTSR